jgi:hypothetical protein
MITCSTPSKLTPDYEEADAENNNMLDAVLQRRKQDVSMAANFQRMYPRVWVILGRSYLVLTITGSPDTTPRPCREATYM